MSNRSAAWLAFLGGLIAALLVVLLIVLLTGGDTADEATPTTDAAPAAVATSTPTTAPAVVTTGPVATEAPASSAPAPDACAGITAVPVPASAQDLTSVNGDLDGDGQVDTLSVFRQGTDWYVHVTRADGHGVQAPLTPYDPGATPWADEVIDVGFQEELGLVGTGFTLVGPIFRVWHYVDCDLRQATADGGDFEPYEGIGVVHSEGFACTTTGMVTYEASQPGADPDAWEVNETQYDWMPAAGDFASHPPMVYATDQATALALTASRNC